MANSQEKDSKFQRFDDNAKVIICANCCTVKDILLVIARKGRFRNDVKLMYTGKYEGIAMEVVSYMTESFGWEEVDKNMTTQITKVLGHEIHAWVVELEKKGSIR